MRVYTKTQIQQNQLPQEEANNRAGGRIPTSNRRTPESQRAMNQTNAGQPGTEQTEQEVSSNIPYVEYEKVNTKI